MWVQWSALYCDGECKVEGPEWLVRWNASAIKKVRESGSAVWCRLHDGEVREKCCAVWCRLHDGEVRENGCAVWCKSDYDSVFRVAVQCDARAIMMVFLEWLCSTWATLAKSPNCASHMVSAISLLKLWNWRGEKGGEDREGRREERDGEVTEREREKEKIQMIDGDKIWKEKGGRGQEGEDRSEEERKGRRKERTRVEW